MGKLILYFSLLQAVAFCCIKASNENGSATTLGPLEEIVYDPSNNNETFEDCTELAFKPDEYKIYPNGSAYIYDHKKLYDRKSYDLDGSTLWVCPLGNDEYRHDPTHDLNSDALHLLTVIGVGVSMLCLLIHLVVFAVVPDMRNLPGCNMASLCASLLLSYTLMIIALKDKVHQNRVACITAAGLMQFFLMASFLWMFVIAFDVFRSIRQATSNLRAAPKEFKVKKFVCNNLIAWGTSSMFTAAAMIVDSVKGVPERFRPQFDVKCWFNQRHPLLIFFGGPVCALIIINFILFGVSAYKIFINRMKSKADNHRNNLIRYHVMYFRLGIIMGVTWVTGTLAPLVNVVWLWFFFAALNAFQGFFIFVGFTCVGKVRRYFRKKLISERNSNKSLSDVATIV